MTRQDRIDALVGDHAARLSARLQAYRSQLFPPDAAKELRKFTSGEVAGLLGVKDAYLRKLHLEGRGPSPRSAPVAADFIPPPTSRRCARCWRPAPRCPAPTCPAGATATGCR